MASESTKKSTTKKETENKKKSVAKKGTKEKKASAKKSTTQISSKKAPKTKSTTKPKTVQKTKSTAKPKTVKKTTSSSSTSKVEEKKIVMKENIKPLSEEKEEKVTIKEEKVKKLEQYQPNKKTHEHFLVYAFLLSTVLICLHVMGRFTFHIDDVTIEYSVILFSTIYFITNVITKKFDFKKSIDSILISMIALILFIWLSKYLNDNTLDSFVIFGQVFAYLISQLLNLMIYYYLLVNTKLKARWIYITYLCSLGTYYFISILFSTRIIMTDTFWPSVFCSIILSAMLAVMYAFYDIFIERGHE